METKVKQRLIGAIVLGALAVIFLPMLLQGPKSDDAEIQRVPLSVPEPADQDFETREVSLELPNTAVSEQGVLGMPATDEPAQTESNQAAVYEEDAVTTVVADTPPPEIAQPTETLLAPAVDAATGKPEAPSKPQASATGRGEFVVNVGSFSNLQAAAELVRKLKQAGQNAYAEPVSVAGKSAMRVRSGPYDSRVSAEEARLKVDRLLNVKSIVMSLEEEAPVAAAPSAKAASSSEAPGFAVQVGAFRQESEARALVARAKAAGFKAFHQSVSTDQGLLYRVRLGPEAERADAEALLQRAGRELGLNGLVVPYP